MLSNAWSYAVCSAVYGSISANGGGISNIAVQMEKGCLTFTITPTTPSSLSDKELDYGIVIETK